MTVKGYFTIESSIRGLTTQQMETALGFRPGRLTPGARILVLDREPGAGQYTPVGSTRFPAGQGLNSTQLEQTKARPGAWLGQRLVKVEPILPHSVFEWYLPSPSPVEQWTLTQEVPAHEVRVLKAGETFWG